MNIIQRDELKKLIEQKKTSSQSSHVILIDVREPEEIKEHGGIDTSINIPLQILEKILTETHTLFKKNYNKTIDKNTKLIFYCRSGNRSAFATFVALKLGYVNAINYRGSILDWAEIDKNVERY